MGFKIQTRRGLKKDAPVLDSGELGYTQDTGELYVGSSVGNQLLIGTKWFNKKANFIGDSITFGLNATKPFPSLIKDDLALSTVRNYGISGCTIAKKDVGNTTNAISMRYTAMDNDADLIVVNGGVNDVGWVIPLGTTASNTVDTFYGSLNVLFAGLINKYPTAKIAVLTPIQANNQNRNTMQTYVDAMVTMANQYSIPVLDLFRRGNVNPYMPVHVTAFIPDGLHPNDVGHRRIADQISTFLNSL